VEKAHCRPPKQNRSRQSFERALDAAADLLAENGLQALTLSGVSRRSKVSIGSIYSRVAGKEDLIRAVQARVLEKLDHEFSGALNRLRRRGLKLAELVPTLVREHALYLRRHARILNAFMEVAPRDPVVQQLGRKYHAQSALDFTLLLLERRMEIKHPNPEQAVDTCFVIVFGVLARYLGFGVSSDEDAGQGEGNWQRIVEDLGLMSLAFLATDLRQVIRQPTAGK
jgi:AcrR family transcriptional regulator